MCVCQCVCLNVYVLLFGLSCCLYKHSTHRPGFEVVSRAVLLSMCAALLQTPVVAEATPRLPVLDVFPALSTDSHHQLADTARSQGEWRRQVVSSDCKLCAARSLSLTCTCE